MSSNIASTAIIYPNVKLGKDVIVEDYCIIGLPFKGIKNEQTVIGDGSVIRSGTYIYAGNNIGRCFQTGNKANIRELNKIGDNVSVGTLSVIEHNVIIGDNVRIHTQAFIPEYTVLEDDCWLGPNVVLTNVSYPKHPTVQSNFKGVIVSKNAKVGANVTLLPGVKLGENSLVGAGSTVINDVDNGVIVAGSPAKVLRDIDY